MTVVDFSRGPVTAGHFFPFYVRFNRVWRTSGSPRDTGGLIFGKLSEPNPVQGSMKSGIPLVHNTYTIYPTTGNVAFSSRICSGFVGRWLFDTLTEFAYETCLFQWQQAAPAVAPIAIISPPMVPFSAPMYTQC